MRAVRRVLITENGKDSEAKVRSWAGRYDIMLGQGIDIWQGKRFITVKYMPNSVEWRHNAEGQYTELVVMQNGKAIGIGLAKHDDPKKTSTNDSCCIAPVLT